MACVALVVLLSLVGPGELFVPRQQRILRRARARSMEAPQAREASLAPEMSTQDTASGWDVPDENSFQRLYELHRLVLRLRAELPRTPWETPSPGELDMNYSPQMDLVTASGEPLVSGREEYVALLETLVRAVSASGRVAGLVRGFVGTNTSTSSGPEGTELRACNLVLEETGVERLTGATGPGREEHEEGVKLTVRWELQLPGLPSTAREPFPPPSARTLLISATSVLTIGSDGSEDHRYRVRRHALAEVRANGASLTSLGLVDFVALVRTRFTANAGSNVQKASANLFSGLRDAIEFTLDTALAPSPAPSDLGLADLQGDGNASGGGTDDGDRDGEGTDVEGREKEEEEVASSPSPGQQGPPAGQGPAGRPRPLPGSQAFEDLVLVKTTVKDVVRAAARILDDDATGADLVLALTQYHSPPQAFTRPPQALTRPFVCNGSFRAAWSSLAWPTRLWLWADQPT